jgi:hypothetical protein
MILNIILISLFAIVLFTVIVIACKKSDDAFEKAVADFNDMEVRK